MVGKAKEQNNEKGRAGATAFADSLKRKSWLQCCLRIVSEGGGFSLYKLTRIQFQLLVLAYIQVEPQWKLFCYAVVVMRSREIV